MATKRVIEVLPGANAVTRRAAALIEAVGEDSASRGDPSTLGTLDTLVLAGGNTPRRVYEHLVKSNAEFVQARLRDLDAEDTQVYGPPFLYAHVFLGDERCVAPEHERSNVGMTRACLLEPLGYAEEQIHLPVGAGEDPQKAAREYEREIHRAFASNWEVRARVEQIVRGDALDGPVPPPDPERWERFDLIMLGLGEDGHTASLFPGSPALEETGRWVVATEHPETGETRLSLTYPCLARARRILFVATGAGKAEAVRRTLEPTPDETPTPAARVTCPNGEILFLLDDAAASGLSDDLRNGTPQEPEA